MTGKILKCGVLLITLMAPVASYADGIGSVTGTSTPQVVTPTTSAPPQTPAYPQQPPGTTGLGGVGSPTGIAPYRASLPGVVKPAH
jgi:hypothetical protein